MKKKLLSFVVALVMLCGGLVFSACGESDKGYQLTNLATDYKAYIEDIDNVILYDTNNVYSIAFDYDSYVSNGSKYLSQKINDTTANNPYAYLNSFYNVLFDNSMSFINNYIYVCSNATINAPTELRNNTKASLNQFNTALKRTSGNVEAIADQIRQGKSQEECLAGLKNLFDSYNNLYQSAFNLTSNLTDIYYNHAIIDSNPNYSTTTVDNYDSSKTLVLYKSRIKQHIADLTQSYYEMNLKGSSLSKDWTTVGSTTLIPTAFVAYKNKVNPFQHDIDDSYSTKINASSYKESFLNYAIAMYNYQSVLDNDAHMYRRASNDTNYLATKSNNDATHYERYCLEIIDNHAYILTQINSVYQNMFEILWRV